MSNSNSSSESDEFLDQNILPYTEQNVCIFDDDYINSMQLSQAFPEEATFRRFDPALKAGHSSSSWVSLLISGYHMKDRATYLNLQSAS
ncbi:hypothetical protein E3N88_30260 [Mikania micrantha]|uniref:Uncharacterized protein n=1 Tax=Mikania micrantha TaxID=192012 RepID=A0A5N6MN99_9ASTR|nr:hypothetical protein E3N88_30260 [Mikania micrantha]